MKAKPEMTKKSDSSVKEQLALYTTTPQEKKLIDTTSTFSENVSLPIHRWFRYSAGFSALWVRNLISKERANGRYTVIDPFAGSGTVLLEAERCGMLSIGLEAHPFVARIANVKLFWREDGSMFREYALSILEEARRIRGEDNGYPQLIKRCFPSDTLCRLDSLRRAWEEVANESPLSELSWLALTSILRECSPVGTAQWQYVLPKKRKAKSVDPFRAFTEKIYLMTDDMFTRQHEEHGPKAVLSREDARTCDSVPDDWADLLITSPPYANNYDYADATRLEMSFWGDVQRWGDLQDKVRKYLVRSCTQHVASMNRDTYNFIQHENLERIRHEITEVCRELEQEREKHGGKKPYHTMIAAYFLDMAKVWTALRRVVKDGGFVCFVVGDSAPYGIYVPVDRWLGELALSAGFKSFRFEKLRDRNIKWKNRKHRVPLHEGRLLIEG